MPWVLAAAAVTVGGTLLASNNASKAADTAAQAQQQATAASIAENAREFDTIQNNNAPYRAIGASSIGALGGAFGLPGYGAPSMTGTPVASMPVGTAGGIDMTNGLRDRAIGLPDGSLGTVAKGGSTDPTAAPSMTGSMSPAETAQWDAYLQQNPDVAKWAADGHGDPSLGPNQTPEQAAAFQYRNTGQAEGRTLPPLSMTATTTPAAPGGYTPPPGYADPTAPNGYNAGARPDAGTAPVRMADPTLNVGLDAYQQSPGLQFQMSQGLNALDHTASSMGGVMSGARTKAALRFSQNLANLDYTDWRNYTTGQFNTDRGRQDQLYTQDLGQYDANRARSDGLYQDDRTFLTGQYNNRSGQLMTLAGFGSNANAQNANAATSFASSDAALRGSAANATGNAAISGANAFSAGVNNLMTTGAYLGGQFLTNPASYYGVNPSTSFGAPAPYDPVNGLY